MKFKRLAVLALAGVMSLSLVTGCSKDNNQKNEDTKKQEQVTDKSLTDIITAMYEIKAPGLMLGTNPVDVSDAGALKSFTGLDSADGIKEVVASEPMMSGQAYSLVLVRLDNASDAEKIAKAMKSGVDTRKWICVEADTMRVVAKGDVVMLVMISSDLAEAVTVDNMVDAFVNVCGETSVDLK